MQLSHLLPSLPVTFNIAKWLESYCRIHSPFRPNDNVLAIIGVNLSLSKFTNLSQLQSKSNTAVTLQTQLLYC